jgi:hypothetical protein
VYVSKPYGNIKDKNVSAIHYLQYMISLPKLQPENLHTELGRKLARGRFDFMKQFADRFIDEWNARK